MAGGPIQLSGLASGIDTASVVQQLVQVESQPMRLMQQQQAQIQDAVSELSGIGSSLSALSSAASALHDFAGVGSFAVTSSGGAVVASSSGGAQPGSYSVTVNALAYAQRTYSTSFNDHATALGMSGSFSIKEGSGTPTTITVTSSDTLDSVAQKINSAGGRETAAVFFDGTNYRLQVQGLDTGAANALTFTENGTSFGFNNQGATVQAATDASITVDGFTVTRPTNQITGVIQGVTLALTQTTQAPVTVSVASDPNALSTKLAAVVTAYNKVVSQVHTAAGYGSNKPQNAMLGGSQALRSILSQVRSALADATSNGSYTMLAQIGLSFQQDGTLKLDSTKLTSAFQNDPQSVESLLGRAQNQTTGGAMATLEDVIKNVTDGVSGTLTLAENSFNSRSTDLDTRIADEQRRLDQYQTMLQKEFTNMEMVYSKNQTLLSQMTKLGTNNNSSG